MRQKPIIITGRVHTLEETRKALGVSKKRAAELQELIRATIGFKVKPKPPKKTYGYHTVKIRKGCLGEISKIQEELEELKDAQKQKVKILVACELADLYGALEDYAVEQGYVMEDLRQMSALTRTAFRQGYR